MCQSPTAGLQDLGKPDGTSFIIPRKVDDHQARVLTHHLIDSNRLLNACSDLALLFVVVDNCGVDNWEMDN